MKAMTISVQLDILMIFLALGLWFNIPYVDSIVQPIGWIHSALVYIGTAAIFAITISLFRSSATIKMLKLKPDGYNTSNVAKVVISILTTFVLAFQVKPFAPILSDYMMVTGFFQIFGSLLVQIMTRKVRKWSV